MHGLIRSSLSNNHFQQLYRSQSSNPVSRAEVKLSGQPLWKRPGRVPIARTEGRKILATIPTEDAEAESETDCSHLVHASTKPGRSNSCARFLGRERRFFANADVTVRRDPRHRRLRDR